MLNYKILHKIIGSLLWLEAALMGVCYIVSNIYREDDSMPFAISIVMTAMAGFVLKYLGRDANNNLSRRDAYLLVSVIWVVFSFFGLLPFIIGGYIPTFTNAFFETMSGFTTTGASIINDVERLPHGILFWRTMTQWIGGLGIVYFTIAILPSLVGSGNMKVFAAETTGPFRSKIHPRLSKNSHAIWMVYIILTVACAVCYYVEGMTLFDCINYSMTTTATGGFATHNMSTEFFGSPAIEYTGTLFCFLSGINFTMLFLLITKFRIKDFLQNTEIKFYLGTIFVATAIIMYYLIQYNHYDLEKAFRYAIFQVVSFITTTGLFSDDAGQWHHVTWIVLAVLMIVGGCAGSTSGGMKSIRFVMIFKMIKNEFTHIIHPNAVLPVRIGNQTIHSSMRTRLLALICLYIFIFILTSTYLTALGVDVINSITISLSCLSNVGPTLGVEIGPTMSWDILPDTCKWVLSFLMLVGRLEIFSVLIIFMPEFWRNK